MLVPTNYLPNLIEFAEANGARPGAIVEAAGLRAELLSDADTRISSEQFLDVIRLSIELSGEPALLLRLGSELRVTSHGILGYAAMSSATLAEALELATRYVQTRTPLLIARVTRDGPDAVLHIDEAAVLGVGRQGLLELSLGAFHSVAHFLVGDRFRVRKLCLPYEEPSSVAEYRRIFDCAIEFGTEATEIRFDASLLELPLPFADEAAKRLGAARCEEELSAIENSDDLEQRMRALLLKAKGSMPALEETARRLGVSSRTLRRRLRAAGTSYREVLNSVRYELAIQYLRTTGMTVYQIADRLGYSDQSNFGRAFKRRAGVSPREFRDAGEPSVS